jgi:uncharacterized OsmC-like protein
MEEPTPASRVDVEELARSIHGLVDVLDADPAAGIVRPWVSTRLEQDVRASSRFTQYGLDFEFRSDEAVDRGGAGSAPSPLRYLLSAVAFCLQGWCAKTWALHALGIEELRVDVRTRMDMRGEHLIPGAVAHPQWLVLDVDMRSEASAERAEAMLREASARCPVTALMVQAIPVYHRLVHNDVLVLDERPAELRAEASEEQTS